MTWFAYIENPKESVKQKATKLNKVAKYKVNIQKSITLLQASKEHLETDMIRTLSFASKNMKYVRLNLRK